MSLGRMKFGLSADLEEERRGLVRALEPHLGTAITDRDEVLLSTREVALLFRVSPATIRRWADAGKLGAHRSLGGHRLFPLRAVRGALERVASPYGPGTSNNNNNSAN